MCAQWLGTLGFSLGTLLGCVWTSAKDSFPCTRHVPSVTMCRIPLVNDVCVDGDAI